MAKKAGSTKRKGSTRKVWHIFHFGERYELPDDVRYCRQTALKYTMDFVSADDDEAISFQQQFDLLKSYPDCLAIKGAFRELKTIAANRSRCYRGYLLNERLQPATTRRISQLLQIDEKLAVRYLKVLEDVGLIERVPVPEFDEKVNTPPPGNGGQTGDSNTERPKRRYKKRVSTGNSSVSGRRRKAFNKVEVEKTENGKGKDKSNIESEIEKEDIKETKTKPQPDRLPSDHSTKKTKLKPRTGAQGAECDSHDDQKEQSTSTYSTDPTTTDAPQHEDTHPTAGPSVPATTTDAGVRSSQEPDGSGGPPRSFDERTFERVYDPASKEFAIEIYTAIGTRFKPDSPEAAGNLGCFAKQWQNAQRSGIGLHLMQELWDKSMAEARSLKFKKRRGVRFTKGPEAVWVTAFKGRLAKMVADAVAEGADAVAERGTDVKAPKVGEG